MILIDESQFQLFYSNRTTYICEANKGWGNQRVLRYSDGMGYFSADGVRCLTRMTTDMDSAVYNDILEQHLLQQWLPRVLYLPARCHFLHIEVNECFIPTISRFWIGLHILLTSIPLRICGISLFSVFRAKHGECWMNFGSEYPTFGTKCQSPSQMNLSSLFLIVCKL